jgi:hypothetical protein
MGGEVPPMLRRPPRQHRLTDSKNRKRQSRTRANARCGGRPRIKLQHELGHHLPGQMAVPARLKLRRRPHTTFGRTNEPAGTPGDGNLEVKPRSNATPAKRTMAHAVRNKLAMLTVA